MSYPQIEIVLQCLANIKAFATYIRCHGAILGVSTPKCFVPSLIVVAHPVSFLNDLRIDFVEIELLCADLPLDNNFLLMKTFSSFYFSRYIGILVLSLIFEDTFL